MRKNHITKSEEWKEYFCMLWYLLKYSETIMISNSLYILSFISQQKFWVEGPLSHTQVQVPF